MKTKHRYIMCRVVRRKDKPNLFKLCIINPLYLEYDETSSYDVTNLESVLNEEVRCLENADDSLTILSNPQMRILTMKVLDDTITNVDDYKDDDGYTFDYILSAYLNESKNAFTYYIFMGTPIPCSINTIAKQLSYESIIEALT